MPALLLIAVVLLVVGGAKATLDRAYVLALMCFGGAFAVLAWGAPAA